MDKYAEKRLLHTPEGVRDIYGRDRRQCNDTG